MIKRLYIHNFRCLEDFTLLLSEYPSVLLIGKNGAGKSTIGAALEALQKIARGENRIKNIVQPEDLPKGRTDFRIEIEATLEGIDYKYVIALELPANFMELRVLNERLEVNSVPLYSRELAQVSHSMSEKETHFSVDWHLLALPILQVRSTNDPLHIFKNWLAQMLIIAPIPQLITGDSEGTTLWPNHHVTNLGEWFTGLTLQYPKTYTVIEKYLKDVMLDFEDLQSPLGRETFRRQIVQFKVGETSLHLPFKMLSDGEKCFFICALVLAASQVNKSLFCFWDEPDNYLAISEVGHFVMALRRAFKNGGQLMVTSHNPEAIQQFANENIFLLHRQNHLTSPTVHRVDTLEIYGSLVDALTRDDVQPREDG